MSYILRPPQAKNFDEMRAMLRIHRSVLLSAECGYGKGVIYSKIVEGSQRPRHSKPKMHVLFLVHGKDRVNDFSERVTGLEIPHGVLMGARRREHWHQVQVASSDTVYRMNHKPKADLIIVDEAHLGMSPSFRAVLDFYPEAKIVGCTATPMLGNGRALGKASGGIFESMVHGPPTGDLIRDGYLVGSRVIAPAAPAELKGLKKKASGEFDDNQGAAICDNAQVIGDVVDHWKRYASDRKAVSFGFNKKHAYDIAQAFLAQGINFAYVDADTPDGDIHTPGTRKFLFHQFDHGDLVGISSCQTISIGWDHSIAKVLLLCSKTSSFPLYRQRLGRGSRPHRGYDHFRVHDHTGNLYEFEDKGPFFESEIEWQLDGDPVKLKDKDKAPRVRTCDTPVLIEKHGLAPGFTGPVKDGYMLPCLRPQGIGPGQCKFCGIPFIATPREIEQAEGELKEVQVVSKSAAQLANEEKLRKRYLELARIAATSLKRDGTPYSKNWPAMAFKGEYHHWPSKVWKDEAEELYGELRPTGGQEELYA